VLVKRWGRLRRGCDLCWEAGQAASVPILTYVVRQDGLSGPDPGPFEVIQARPVPPVLPWSGGVTRFSAPKGHRPTQTGCWNSTPVQDHSMASLRRALNPDVLLGDGIVAPLRDRYHSATAFELPNDARPFP
jgi:hypothetical protein